MSGGKKTKTGSKIKNKKGGAADVLIAGTTPDGIKWEKAGAAANANLNIYLKQDQKIVADKHAMIFMDGDMKLETEMGGIKKAFGRMLSGETAFLSYYTGTNPTRDQRITLGMPYTGDIMHIQLTEGDKWTLSRGSFLAGTDSVAISGKLNLKGAISVGQQEGAVLSTVSSKSGPAGVWLGAYGQIEAHVLKDGESLLVDNEHFLACDSSITYTISKVGNVKSLVFGGEGFAMKFVGPCTVYTQSKGLIAFVDAIAKYIPQKRNSGGIRINI
jgi:uncharacterized protein (TIGR00266 family)